MCIIDTSTTKTKDEKMRQATREDFKQGQYLIDAKGGWEVFLKREYDPGIWEARIGRGYAVVYASNARFYLIKEQ